MIQRRLLCYILVSAALLCFAECKKDELLSDLRTLVPPCSVRELIEVLPRNSAVVLYYHDRYPNGAYDFGYILGSGERRGERGVSRNGLVHVDGFYSKRKTMNSKVVYETIQYTAGQDGYYPSMVRVTYDPPKMSSSKSYESENGEEVEMEEEK